ncbi:unnamed protein product [Rhizoctonia solani]|uniref:Uncharacterized protein n=1 Tax=Rhizoctonia solani TaxID=456999 RepID=A0A8H3D7Y6_9AGAM|nr:unnamed protein product [Rhizoctonia solani]
MKLTDHLFGAQMGGRPLARYRSKYSLITFPSVSVSLFLLVLTYFIWSGQDATYTPPVLPTHIPINLKPISGAPTDDEIIKAQEVFQTYQELRRVPSMFDAHVNMELSQHLFDIQMARYMRVAGERPPSPVPQAIPRPEHPAQLAGTSAATEEVISTTNNAGTGAEAARACQVPRSTPGIDMHELMERSNHLAERFNQLLEQSNEIAEQRNQPTDQSSSHPFAERFNQVLERLTQLFEQSHQPAARTDQLTERFNQLFERFNQLAEQSYQPAQRANELAEKSNQFAEQAIKPVEKLGDLVGNINRVLVGIQHAIVR